MTDFIATLAPQRVDNWEICKRERLWGVVGNGPNWKKNADRLQAGDRIFVWRGGRRNNGFIAQMEALGSIRLTKEPGVVVPWPEPEWFGGVFPMRIVAELERPVSDSFKNENGRVGLRFGFNNTVLQHIFEEISTEVAGRIAALFPAIPAGPGLGVPYTPAPPPSPVSPAEPFDVDPDLVDRGRAAHHATVEALAAWVRSKRFEPLLPAPGEPLFDLAWLSGDLLNVAEVKSVTPKNEESQLRLGLGQVLRYRQQLGGNGRKVRAWLVPEREPSDGTWAAVCSAVGVRLSWPALWR